MEESQGIDMNEVALENIIPMEGEITPPAAPEPSVEPEPLPTNNETEPAEPQTPDETAANIADPAIDPEGTGTGTLDDPIKIDTTVDTPEEGQSEDEALQEADDFNEEEQNIIFNEHLAYHTDGKIQSLEDITNMEQELETLRNQPQQPEFTSESAKKLFEFAKNSENPLAMGKNYLHAVSLDLDTLSEKQKMFEAYVLDEQNSDLTREQALEIFNEEYEDNYGDAEDTVTGKRKMTLAVRAAEEKIKSMQEDAMSAKSKDAETSGQPSPEVMDEIYMSIDDSLADFQAIAIPAGEDNQFNFEVESPDEIEEFSEAAKDPMGWLQEQINSFQNQNTGEFDYDGYNAFIGSLFFSGQIAEGMFKHGQNNGTRTMVENLQNPTKPGSQTPTTPVVDNRSHQDKIWDKLADKMANF